MIPAVGPWNVAAGLLRTVSTIRRADDALTGTANLSRGAEGRFLSLEQYDEAREGHGLVLGWFGVPRVERPELHMGDRVLEVIDCSETGLRYALPADEPPPAVGGGIRGLVRFSQGDEAQVEGEIRACMSEAWRSASPSRGGRRRAFLALKNGTPEPSTGGRGLRPPVSASTTA